MAAALTDVFAGFAEAEQLSPPDSEAQVPLVFVFNPSKPQVVHFTGGLELEESFTAAKCTL